MTDADKNLHEFNRQMVWAGFRQLVPIAVFVTLFGAAFGLAAIQAGPQVPLFTLVITVFAINARHLLMGATLYPWLRHLPPAKRYGVMLIASDANWAMSLQAFNRGQPGIGLLLGGGLALWSFWVVGTWLGIYFGGAIQEPRSLGLDMVMGCFLLAMVVGGEKNLRLLMIWIVAACASLLAYWYLPDNSHVVVGALAGGLAGTFWTEKKNEH
ncbi:AzlC protein [compost metagenome]